MCMMSAMSVVAQSHQGHSHAKVNRSDANIVGHVIDAANGQHVPFVNVTLKGTTIGTTTDESGHYFLKNLQGDVIAILNRNAQELYSLVKSKV